MAESLNARQDRFCGMVAELILHAHRLGYRVSFGDAYRDPRVKYGTAKSFHRKRLAIDLNLFDQNAQGKWRYLRTTKAHVPLGVFWESIGGTWGGRFKRPDGNHYSLGE